MSEQSAGTDQPLTLQSAQAEVDATIYALGGYWPPLANLARLFEECGELARVVNQIYGPKQRKSGEATSALQEELGDVLYVTLALANSLEVDADAALKGVLRKVRGRIPAAPHVGKADGETAAANDATIPDSDVH
ncbi:MAG: MazG nucleotide pyrophosphohydrolase domain-containing protein [Ktedonobacterales bacterium]